MLNYQAEQVQNFHEQKFEFLEVNHENHVLTITLNRPEKKNALHPLMMAELAYCASFARYNKDVWCVVLEAKGDIFCAGADLKAFAGQADGTKGISTIPMPTGEVLLGELFPRTYKPCIAKVRGHVFAGGFLLIGGCTHVVSVDEAQFGLPEVKRGIWPMQVMATLQPIMPARKILDLCMRGLTLSAQQAYELGLVTQVVPKEALDSHVTQLVNEILENSPSAIRLGLQAFYEMQSLSHEEQHPYLKNMLGKVLQTQDAQEGITAFMQKRKPQWKGE